MPLVKVDPERIAAEVRQILRALQAAGIRCWLVGGTVRDLLLGDGPADYDIAADAPPEQVQAALGRGSLEDARLGTCRIDGLPWPVVVTTLREEGGYADRRHPDEVRFCQDPAVDARRRDFGCNALYLDAASWEVLDPCGGLSDLAARRLCVIGPPEVRFAEDPLRMLRMVRFAARFGFDVDPAAMAAAAAAAPLVQQLSGERVYDELTRTFCGPGRGRGLRLLCDAGLAAVLLPEVAAMAGVPQPPQYHPEGCVLTHVCLVLDHAPPSDPTLSWAAVLHDVGKPPTFRVAEDRIRFDGHDTLSARMAESILHRLHAPKALVHDVVELCRDHIRIASLLQMRPRRRERWMREPLFAKHLAFHRADCLGSHGDLSIYKAAVDLLAALPPVAESALCGKDVLALGVQQGPIVGQILREAERRLDAFDGKGPSREQALQVLAEVVRDGVKPGG